MAGHSSYQTADTADQPRFVVTRPDMIVRHEISDEELETLCDSSPSPEQQIFWTALGGLTGALPGAVSAVAAYSVDRSTLTVDLLASLVLAGIALAVTIVGAYLGHKKGSKNKLLRDAIRKRKLPRSGG